MFRYVLLLTLALLVVYMLSTFTTLVWLACPFYGNLARFMGNYQVIRNFQYCSKKINLCYYPVLINQLVTSGRAKKVGW